MDAARAGKHVLVEKPLATSREDVNAIVQAAKQNGVRVMCDLHNRVTRLLPWHASESPAENWGRCAACICA